MKLRSVALAAAALLPFGAALADYADPPALAAPMLPPADTRTAEHFALIDAGAASVKHATEATRELAIGLQSAQRDRDMLLVTCLADALATARAVQAEAIRTQGALEQTRTPEEARALAPLVAQANGKIDALLDDASRCAGADDTDATGSTFVEVTRDPGFTLDPGGNAPTTGAPTGVTPPPSNQPPATIDVLEPGTDMPMIPPTASPMR